MSQNIRQAKQLLRKNHKPFIHPSKIQTESAEILRHLISLEVYRNCKSVSIFLSTDSEVNTLPIIRHIFISGKVCFIPKCNGKTMRMVQLKSLADYESLPTNAWGIKEPIDNDRLDSFESQLDLVIVPGLAFDLSGNRIGYGKGYYDSFLEALENSNNENGLCHTRTGSFEFNLVAIGLSSTLVDSVPVDSFDIKPDLILIGPESTTDQVIAITNTIF